MQSCTAGTMLSLCFPPFTVRALWKVGLLRGQRCWFHRSWWLFCQRFVTASFPFVILLKAQSDSYVNYFNFDKLHWISDLLVQWES